jgi:hypothetical protein
VTTCGWHRRAGAAVTRLEMAGAVRGRALARLGRHITQVLVVQRPEVLVIDLGAVTALSPAAVRTLVTGYRTAIEYGTTYRVINPRGPVRTMVQAAGVPDVLADSDDRCAAAGLPDPAPGRVDHREHRAVTAGLRTRTGVRCREGGFWRPQTRTRKPEFTSAKRPRVPCRDGARHRPRAARRAELPGRAAGAGVGIARTASALGASSAPGWTVWLDVCRAGSGSPGRVVVWASIWLSRPTTASSSTSAASQPAVTCDGRS